MQGGDRLQGGGTAYGLYAHGTNGRYQQLYGADYQDPALYDAVINVDERCRDANFNKVVRSLPVSEWQLR